MPMQIAPHAIDRNGNRIRQAVARSGGGHFSAIDESAAPDGF
jgi:hypothetical protein